MQHVLRYKSSRKDVWRWYWKAWQNKLWKIHVFFALISSFFISTVNTGDVYFAVWSQWFIVVFILTIVLSVAFSQFMFKSSERVLTVDADGWTTQIGKKSGSKSWQEIESVKEEFGKILITGKNGNALIIPEKAFSDAESRRIFLENAQNWKNAHK